MKVPEVQQETLLRLVSYASGTLFARDHRFHEINSIETFQKNVPVREYEFFWDRYWKDAYPRLEGLTWPDKIPYYALSSGTTSGSTKYIPISHQMIASNKKAAFTLLSFFKNAYPESRIFNGKVFFLSGNTDMKELADGSRAGDLSAVAAREVWQGIRPYTFPPMELARIPDWETKVQKLAEAAAREPITAISGVPSWILFLFDRLKKVTGKNTIADIWPLLRLVIHGGTRFDPYRELFQKEIGSDQVQFVDTYPSSEGYIATEDPRYKLLRVIPDCEIFYEFIPFDELGKDNPTRHTLATVETGVNYAVVLTSCAGMWANLLGDTVVFEKRDPPLLRFSGRTKYFLSAFGEHLISEEIEKAIAEAARQTDAVYSDFHVGPIFSTDPSEPGTHRYLIEFRRKPKDMNSFIKIFDDYLKNINEDYEAHRKNNLTMRLPVVDIVKENGFLEWMLAHGKRPPQHKVPRMDNTGKLTESMRSWFSSHQWLDQ